MGDSAVGREQTDAVPGGRGTPAWAPRSWHHTGAPRGRAGGSRWGEELDVDPRALARRIREHRARGGRGLIDFDAPAAPDEPAARKAPEAPK